jgi:hypothetical protein
MVQSGLRESGRQSTPAEQSWWQSAPELLREVERQQHLAPKGVASYQVGDTVLQVAVDDPLIRSGFQEFYGDCEVPARLASAVPEVRCTVRRWGDPPLVVLSFQKGAPADLAGAAYGVLRLTRAGPPWRVYDAPYPGWRLGGGATGPVLAACGSHMLLEAREVPPAFVVEYLVGVALAMQRGLLAFHGATLRVGNAGLVLTGGTRAGKTTTALHVAARGHALLGDEIALIRIGTGDILPLRRTANLRPGPYGRELAAALGFSRDRNAPEKGPSPGVGLDGDWTGPRRISELFPERPARPAPLRAVFFLRGFDSRPSLEPFRLTVDRSDIFDWLTTGEITQLSWGLEPAKRALRLLLLQETLARVPCWLLTVGTPHETTEVIERTMEGLQC